MVRVTLGRTHLSSSPIGLGASYGLDARGVHEAFEGGLNLFYWGAMPRSSFGRGVRELATTHRSEMVIVLHASALRVLLRSSFERELRRLRLDYADMLLLGWRNELPSPKVLEVAQALKAEGKVRHVAISCHHRPSFKTYIEHGLFDLIMVRYNAAHPGAEREVFPLLPGSSRPAVLAYTATRWGALLDPGAMPPGEATPRASDCYRFCLSHADVDACLAGPKNTGELREALAAIARGPLTEEELLWMRRVGSYVHDARSAGRTSLAGRFTDWIRG